MKRSKKHVLLILISVFSLITITACSNMSTRDKNTAIGAGGGAILTEGSGLGTVGGAAIGGVIGHQVGK